MITWPYPERVETPDGAGTVVDFSGDTLDVQLDRTRLGDLQTRAYDVRELEPAEDAQ